MVFTGSKTPIIDFEKIQFYNHTDNATESNRVQVQMLQYIF